MHSCAICAIHAAEAHTKAINTQLSKKDKHKASYHQLELHERISQGIPHAAAAQTHQKKTSENLNEVLAAAVTLQESGQPDVMFDLKMPDEDIWAEIDATMLSQALTNVLKNAGEAIEAGWRSGLGTDREGEIRVEMQAAQSGLTIAISDNGIGLPQDRSKLFEPYVTTRENGTGLGLAIVKKIIQEHGGTLSLLDAAPFSNGSHPGAKVLIDLTHSDQTLMDSEQKEPN